MIPSSKEQKKISERICDIRAMKSNKLAEALETGKPTFAIVNDGTTVLTDSEDVVVRIISSTEPLPSWWDPTVYVVLPDGRELAVSYDGTITQSGFGDDK